ncbi:MAG: HigA family addiction module antitoxin [Gemmatimonadota bacterium]|uniref:HigA family addiction module antitoxin n=1 Tax=Candidatus Palauibacter scopulicola TaxID=3056741 RepID=UPI002392F054|nr:HigA family addiction module antitoxin [Candidatus Palauibacter scopulicola]MDE2663093.1 HigA family addiction module antitoxin [Candidatus Palauibacter scopulicola]
MPEKTLAPVHPGEVLLEEFLEPMGISQYRLAKDIDVAPGRINQIVHGRRAVTANTALRLSHYFGTSARFWLNLQTGYDLDMARDLPLPAEMPRAAG